MRDKCLLIINPISGTASRKDVPVRTMRRLRREGIDVEVMYTEKAGDAATLAAMAATKGYLGVIAAGGDGTVNEIASSLVGTRTALGIIPLGSGNGLARHIGLTTDVGEALNLIARRHIEACDSCAADGRPFFCTFGLGFDAAVSEKFSRSRRRGLMNYLRSVMTEYLKYSPEEYEIEANGHTVRLKAFIVAACNASQYGNNAFIAPQASIRDGLVDITIVHAGTPLTRAFFGVDLMTGYVRDNMIIQTLRTDKAVIRRTSPGIAHVDGDPLPMGEEITVKCLPGSLLMFTQPDKKPFRPFITPLSILNREIRSRLRRLFGARREERVDGSKGGRQERKEDFKTGEQENRRVEGREVSPK